ncbi:cytochrome c biogenesis protein ResB [Corynebacterium gottingense]|uniref:Cytochrome c biogenesis protein ResB n=1 Tax=Corynebacterium gottingense TaxID=2041036 RepID=A0ABX9UMK5_9CORY|nr:cytochrome c biogenesis protein ResB [Corynebacterium gottingense]RMD20593.1 cytochrome c biogenesis protein ResB [Corynebacterium gottingense]WJZ12243.1 Cytochrome c biogenesis protein Ccs1 [Corynebacterium gottingense]WJZ14562.1 Cytochrome c biogenesis protein Ccs1 [Corynebacterium gottingense]
MQLVSATTTWLRKTWHWLTSMRTALVLLFLLSLASIPGALLPQRNVSESLVQDYLDANPTMGPIYDRLQLFDVFSSSWFVAIVTLLMISLVGCIIPRSMDHWRAYRATPTRAPRYLSRMPMHAQATVDAGQDEVEAKVRRLLKRWHVAAYSPEEDRAGTFSLAAERGYTRELMNLLFHVGIVGMIVAFAAGRMVFYEGQVIVVTNSESQYAVPVEQSTEFCNTSPANFDVFRAGPLFDGTGLTPFCIDAHNFRAEYLNSGQANGFWSDVSYTDDLTAPKDSWQETTLAVNHPLRIHGDRVYLQGHGFAPQVTVTWPNGETRTQMMQFRPTDTQTFLSSGVMRFDPPAGMFPDLADRRQNQIALEGNFAPTAQWGSQDGETLQSSFPSMDDPALSMDIYRGDAGLDSGRPQNIFVLDQMLIAEGQLQKLERVNLTPGEEITVDGGIKVRFDGAAEYANYQISRDPTQVWALVTTVIMLAALAGSLTIKRRRVWVRLAPVAGGGTAVEIAGLARTDRAGWGPEFSELVEEILGEHPDDDGDDDELDDLG